MKLICSSFGIAVLTSCLAHLALSTSTSYRLVEELKTVPSGWSRGREPPASTVMTFQLAISQPKVGAFEQTVIDLSTPGHPNYGQHMKREQVDEFLRPQNFVTNQVLSWLDSENVSPSSISVKGNWITFQVTLPQAERMLRTRFYYFHNEGDTTVVRTLRYSVPQEIHPHIQLIQPTTRFGQFKPQRSLPLEEPVILNVPEDLAADCNSLIKPECLRMLYGLNSTKASPDPRNRLGISGYLEQYARHGDFSEFLANFTPNETDSNFTVVAINGGLNEEDSLKSSSEASLDVQYGISIAYHTLATYYTTGGRGPLVPDGDQPNPNDSSNEPYLEQLHYLTGLPDEQLPAILTTSYGENEQSVPSTYAVAVCTLFAQLGARGVSVIFSSGDAGPGESCRRNDGTNRTAFLPGFPASCPFVTSVGGTYGSNPEKAIYFSGGGFSEVFPRPLYQAQAVQDYFGRLGNQWKGLYNPQGRGIPDVAAQSSNFVIRDHGLFLKIGGTSASAPVFAGIISQLNAIRLVQGKPRLGFLNPWLYSTGQTGFTDIVNGSSRGCYSVIPTAGWGAVEGWDPVTGLGTPFFPRLAQVL